MKKETSEVLKSAAIGIVALTALICWLKFQPRLPDVKPKEKVGRKLLENFDDPGKMHRVEFTRINPDTGEIQQLLLVRDGDVWRLPGTSNFPAENAEQVAKVVAPLTQLLVLDVVDETIDAQNPTQTDRFHRECGLVNPLNFDFDLDSVAPVAQTSESVNSSSNESEIRNLALGSALAVKIEGSDGEILVDLLIGNRIPESSLTRDDRFVRFPNEDVVYTVDFSGDSTQEQGTTEFTEYPDRVSFTASDWIDQDLLRISRWDVLHLTIRDYGFSLLKTDSLFEQTRIIQNGAATFKQNPENSLSRIWTLERLVSSSVEGGLQDASKITQEQAQNEVLNATADALASLKVVDVRKKPDSLSTLFRENQLGTELTSQTETLGEFGFSFFDQDLLNKDRTSPLLVGEGGTVELITKNGISIVLIFGKRFEDKRACLAYSTFNKVALIENADDESEVAFLAPDAEKKAQIKNNRLADWFYLISEEEYQKITFRLEKLVSPIE